MSTPLARSSTCVLVKCQGQSNDFAEEGAFLSPSDSGYGKTKCRFLMLQNPPSFFHQPPKTPSIAMEDKHG